MQAVAASIRIAPASLPERSSIGTMHASSKKVVAVVRFNCNHCRVKAF